MVMNNLLRIIVCFILALTVVGFLGKFSFWFDLASHFRWQYLICCILCSIVFWQKKKVGWLLVIMLAGGVNLFSIVPYYLPQSQEVIINDDVEMVLINVRSQNTDFHKVIDYINQVNPDILALQEINDQWMAVLAPTLEQYPFAKYVTRQDNFGIGLFSKRVLNKADIYYFGGVGVPSVVADFKLAKKPVSLIVTHPIPPVSPSHARSRNDQLDSISAQRERFQNQLVVLGDLNMSSWSYYFQKFLKENGLKDSRVGFGLQLSWPTFMPLLWTTIDHCLVTKDMVVLERQLGPYVGSDHYPIRVRLGI